MPKTLSIFLDEAGDAGPYEYHSPYYVVSFVFHNQENDIGELVKDLDKRMDELGYGGNAIHAGPIIRNEKEYEGENPVIRQKLFKSLMTFFRKCPINIHTIYVEKKHVEDKMEISGKLSQSLFRFLTDKLSFFQQFDELIIYYDNGQGVVSELISHIFPLLINNVSFRKVYPSQYRLFQVADMLCTMKHIELKMIEKRLSKSELNFFEGKDNPERTIKKEYLKHIKEKEI